MLVGDGSIGAGVREGGLIAVSGNDRHFALVAGLLAEGEVAEAVRVLTIGRDDALPTR